MTTKTAGTVKKMKDISSEIPFTMKSPDCCIQNSSFKINVFFTLSIN